MLGPLISAGASLLGGFLNRDSAKEANAANAAMAERNIQLQREFAQNAIQWKAADAAKAGIHPLYALGAGTTSFSPVSVGATADTSMGSALHSMGQDISRAVAAPMSPGTKVQGALLAQQSASNVADIEYKQLRNQELRLRIAGMAQPGTPPGIPLSGGTAGQFEHGEKSKPEERPPLMLGGHRVFTDPHTSPMKAWEDQIGDEGPGNWVAQSAVIDSMMKQNFGQPQTWPAQMSRWLAQSIWEDMKSEGSNARRFGRRYLPGVIGP